MPSAAPFSPPLGRAPLIAFLSLAFFPLSGQDHGPERLAPFFGGVLPSLQPGPAGSWTVVEAFPNLPKEDEGDPRFVFEPVYLTGVPRSNLLCVCDKKGKIWSFENHPGADRKTLFLDLSDRVKITPNAGMGTMAFHPDFGLPGSPKRGFVYLHYFWSPDRAQLGPSNQEPESRDYLPLSGYWRLSRFTVPDGSVAADPDSESILIQQYDAHHWHNGGSLFFDNDGYLYVGSGDIGGDRNPYQAGQTLTGGLFGGILRIDVDCDPARSHPIRRQPGDHDFARKTKPKSWTDKSYSQGYFIPNDNPWQDEGGAILEEFWCVGIRSPHRMSYDPPTGRIWMGDVGQSRREEINGIVKGGNYQWPYRDGTLPGYAAKPSKLIGTDQPPIYEYSHGPNGAAVIGGYVYRGYEHRAELEGKYLFAEHQGGQIWALDGAAAGAPKVSLLTTIKGCGFHNGPSSFGQDNNGELYICLLGRNAKNQAIPGKIVKLARSARLVHPEAPPLLSQTGIFSRLSDRTPAPALIPYAPSVPFWSDSALKTRHMVIPVGQKIRFSPDENWQFPVGSVFVKHFDYPVDERDPSRIIPIETRLLIHGKNGQYFGLSYRWNEAGDDAELLSGSDSREIPCFNVEGNEQTGRWYYPSRAECLHCHTAAAGYVLGVRTHQLNSPMRYPNGFHLNQLQAMNDWSLFDQTLSADACSALPSARPFTCRETPLETRVRSYLDANCSPCHRPGGVYAGFDARFTTPLADQGLINGALIRDYGVEGQRLICPGDPAKSILLHRLASAGEEKMPPLAKNSVDQDAVALVTEWILSLANQQECSSASAPSIPEEAPAAE